MKLKTMKYKFMLFIMLLDFSKSFSQLNDCSTCSKKSITKNSLKDKTVEELRLLRNEIYARNGYVFKDQQFSRYFEAQEWYKPLNNNNAVSLSNIEDQNISIIKKLEKEEKATREKAFSDLQKLKKALNNNNIDVIKTYISEQKATENRLEYESSIKQLKFFLSKINLENIYWNKKSGYYKFSIDNGYSIHSYKLIFSKKEIQIGGGMYSHSANFGDFEDGYSDYMSEAENQTFWFFNITEKGLAFDHIQIFG